MNQCFARTKNWERCRNHTEPWSLFCRRHRWWGPITLIGAVVTGTTICANMSTIFGITLPIPLLATSTISAQEISTPLYSSSSIRLIPIDGQNIVVKLGNQTLPPNSTVPLNQTITVIFKVLNNGTSPITIKALVIGSRGPGVNCENPNVEKWSAADNPFPTPRNITIQPGEMYQYEGSRAFYLPGKYFLEPIIQGSNDKWGGIQPFSCISITVDGTQSAETETSTSTPTFTPISTLPWTPSIAPSPTQTNTPHPTKTPTITPLSPADYAGLELNCIPDLYWDVEATQVTDSNGCLQMSAWGFYADKQTIIINQPSEKVRAGDYTANLFMPLGGPVDISFSVYLESFRGSESSNTSPLFSVGVCNPNRWEKSFKFISFSYQDNSVQWGILIDQTKGWHNRSKAFRLKDTIDYSIEVRPFTLGIRNISSNELLWRASITPDERGALCIQYRMPINGTLIATVSNILIMKR